MLFDQVPIVFELKCPQFITSQSVFFYSQSSSVVRRACRGARAHVPGGVLSQDHRLHHGAGPRTADHQARCGEGVLGCHVARRGCHGGRRPKKLGYGTPKISAMAIVSTLFFGGNVHKSQLFSCMFIRGIVPPAKWGSLDFNKGATLSSSFFPPSLPPAFSAPPEQGQDAVKLQMQWSTRGPEPYCKRRVPGPEQKVECQRECQNNMSDRIPENMADRNAS